MAEGPESEAKELAQIYAARELTTGPAPQVAEQLMAHDTLSAHARDEPGISEFTAARPVQAAFTSAATFPVGAAAPLPLVLGAPDSRLVPAVATGSILCLAPLGWPVPRPAAPRH